MWMKSCAGMTQFTALFMTFMFLAGNCSTVLAKDGNRIVIATGAVTSGYFILGGAICARLNSDTTALRCAAEPSTGTLANLRSLGQEKVDLALIQSDWQHHAYAGSVAEFSGGKALKNMRALAAVTGSPLVLLARADSGIQGIEDLEGKRLDIGKRGAGRRAAMDDLIAALGWDLGKFKLASELPEAEAIQALCGGRLDVLALAGATPDRSVTQALRSCPLKLIPVTGSAAQKLITDKPYYSVVSVPAGSYPGVAAEVPGIGVRVILLASSKLAEKDAYAVVKAIAGDVDTLRKLHPSFASITKAGLAKAGISVPLHDGAARYYREAKLLN